MKFLEKTIFKNLGGFQELSTEEKQRYVTLFGHHHFSQWFVGLAVQPWLIPTISIITIILCVWNMAMILFVEERNIYMTVFFISFRRSPAADFPGICLHGHHPSGCDGTEKR